MELCTSTEEMKEKDWIRDLSPLLEFGPYSRIEKHKFAVLRAENLVQELLISGMLLLPKQEGGANPAQQRGLRPALEEDHDMRCILLEMEVSLPQTEAKLNHLAMCPDQMREHLDKYVTCLDEVEHKISDVEDGSELNDTVVQIEVLSKVAEEENTGKHYSFIDLFRTPVLRKVSICVTCAWFGASFSYYGISFNITGFKLDIYMTQFLYGAIEIPFKLGLYIFLKKAGRRHALAWSLLITGFCIGINIMIPVCEYL
ncbi:hypothetical protein NDU88_000686 [Pleurodeles waltl]|uniref:Uncharacterized protein n=1 Tax=Pleurodeles waltl TaxID=8319 RepID=A0AAV7R7H6_PLEWA|nr:hypothetical protein NDU88_000682 [Pleurodeles waltl]KAJ1147832.1 hypothetical protein NDU88_000684 [Pleurodeles waltl]KAJ1147836.1 hypothetical protein NDU88_000686 [Pleurodeles waltl]